MAEEASAPLTVDATKAVEDATRSSAAPAESTTAELNPVAGGDVANAGEAAKGSPLPTTKQDTPTVDAASTDATAGATNTEAGTAAEPTTEATAANGTPTPAKKGAPNRRKSGAGIPEHRQKKTPSKKKSPPEPRLNVQPGEVWFVAMRGYQPWPVIICDEEMLPEALLSKRPVSAKRIDGTYREDYMEGGKNAKDRRYPVMFLGTNEFAWQVNTELQPFELDVVKQDVESGNNAKKSKALWEAYQIAAEGHDLAYYKDLLDSHEKALQADIEEKAAVEAKKQEKKGKAKRKSIVADESEDAEMEDADAEGAASAKKAKASKKRKKDTDSDGEPEKPAKTPKTKLKLNNKAPKDASATKPKKEPKAKKAKAKSESEEAEPQVERAVIEEKPMTDAERREKQEKSVLYLRHRLQKGFLARDHAPKEEEMGTMADYFAQLEEVKNLEAEVIKKTKVHKVLKAIIKLESIPKEEEFNFKKRSSDLLQSWSGALAAEGDGRAASEAATAAATVAEPATNGVNHDDKKEHGAADTKDEASAKSVTTKIDTSDGDVAMADAPAETSTSKPEATPSAATEPAAE